MRTAVPTLLLATAISLSAGCGTVPLDAVVVEKNAPATTTAYASAAVDNARLAGEIEWDFAGRTQKGWGLYWALVSDLVGTDATPASPEFASAVAEWERKQGVKPADAFVVGWSNAEAGVRFSEVRVSSVPRYFGSFTPAVRHEPDEHAVALYRCDAAAGDVLVDSSGRGHHGTIHGACEWAWTPG